MSFSSICPYLKDVCVYNISLCIMSISIHRGGGGELKFTSEIEFSDSGRQPRLGLSTVNRGNHTVPKLDRPSTIWLSISAMFRTDLFYVLPYYLCFFL